MRQPFRWLLASAAFVALEAAALYAGIRVNVTSSIPKGVYITERLAMKDGVQVGEVVCFDPRSEMAPRDAAMHAPRELTMLKVIAAREGSLVDVDPSTGGLLIDGTVLPCSEIHDTNGEGQALPRQHFPVRVPPKSVWLMSKHPRGWDSRYFGPVSLTTLSCRRGRALWTWEPGNQC